MRAPPVSRSPRKATDPRRAESSLEDLAALGAAFQRRAGFGPTLALAGILALARVGGTLTGALALAGVGAAALLAIGMSGRGEAAGCEDGGGRGDDGALGHDVLCSLNVASDIDAAGRPCT